MSEILVTSYGADPTGTTDSLAAIEDARDAAIAASKTLVFPQGTYKISATLELGYPRLHVRGEERAVIQADFTTGPIVSVSNTGIAYQFSLRNILLVGKYSGNTPVGTEVGLRTQNVVHGVYENIRVRNVTRKAFHVTGDVLSVYSNLVSDQQNDGLSNEMAPEYDLYIDGTTLASSTTACQFSNCILERGTLAGLYIAKGTNNIFKGGGAEGLPGRGVILSADAYRNQFDQFYCEYNAGGDFDISGTANVFVNCEAYDLTRTTTSFHVKSGAARNIIEKCGSTTDSGAYTIVQIDAGAEDTVVRDCALYKLTDSGTRTWLENWSDQFNGVAQGGSRTFTPTFAGSSTAGAFVYDVRSGTATRIGRRVFIDIALRISSVTNGATGSETRITGLPWSASGGSAAVVDEGGMTYPGASTVLGGYIDGNRIVLRGNKNAGPVDPATLNAWSYVRLTGNYEVA
ncbi:glycoside hydrolase family 55 protein [Sphingomonas psychrotolerans]|uniref:Glycoside hydrolase family 55 protein n=1 Tax=Sphingomonas psychrotolerans TaxID=1327635 RepID=A0ABU3N0Q7_9SPHN|nr:glycosyl hydrolase family 28-related protein [Sphingomonas psychrotolerans]MDT8757352.1 glycoside hydrolase family 55 protein [Sphingomonas psychrotolerans]